MNAKHRPLFWTLSLLLLLSCAPSTMNYEPAQRPNLTPKKAKAVIRETILNQPGNHAPQGVLINDEVLEIRKITAEGRGRRRSSITEATTIPFSSIGNLTLARATVLYVVTIFDRENAERYRVYTTLDSQAKDLIDALRSLMMQRPPEAPLNRNSGVPQKQIKNNKKNKNGPGVP